MLRITDIQSLRFASCQESNGNDAAFIDWQFWQRLLVHAEVFECKLLLCLAFADTCSRSRPTPLNINLELAIIVRNAYVVFQSMYGFHRWSAMLEALTDRSVRLQLHARFSLLRLAFLSPYRQRYFASCCRPSNLLINGVLIVCFAVFAGSD